MRAFGALFAFSSLRIGALMDTGREQRSVSFVMERKIPLLRLFVGPPCANTRVSTRPGTNSHFDLDMSVVFNRRHLARKLHSGALARALARARQGLGRFLGHERGEFPRHEQGRALARVRHDLGRFLGHERGGFPRHEQGCALARGGQDLGKFLGHERGKFPRHEQGRALARVGQDLGRFPRHEKGRALARTRHALARVDKA
ncbi:hypothetical protein Scep_022018 [Stephania cephalantha]|uniref:Uncharacterized protein n=1 Tax=Stephania cephalantha TaxID=152367 RepID=A0AAP0FFV8_9MAGN